MIFATVGTQGQFDRLIRAIDTWAGLRDRSDVFAQTGRSEYRAEHIRTEQFIDAVEFRRQVEAANLVISHAGMGSIITALELGKQIIVMPRKASLGEHRNDHQLATAKRFAEQGRILVAFNEEELIEKLDQAPFVARSEPLSTEASPRLIATIRTFIKTGGVTLENGDTSA